MRQALRSRSTRQGPTAGRVVALATLLALAACDSPAGTDSAPAAPQVGPGVLAAVESGEARVMVSLRATPEIRADWADAADGGDAVLGLDAPVDADGLARATRLDARVAQVDALVRGVLDRAGGVEVDRRFAAVPGLALTVRDTAVLRRLADDPAVVRIDLDVGGTGTLATSVPQTGADVRHARGNTGAGEVLAVLDTGVDTDHPSLDGRIVAGACFSNTGHCPGGGNEEHGLPAAEDDVGHGTHVAGIMAADGSVGSPGMAPAASLVAVKIMYDCDTGSGCFESFSEIVAGLDYLITYHDSLGTRAVNMSLGSNTRFAGVCDGVYSWTQVGATAVSALRDLGVVVVASSGNDDSSVDMGAPACLSGVLAVAAVGTTASITSFSNTNAETDLAAPGVAIVSLAVGGTTQRMTGTSMAAPHVTGCAALIFEEKPAWTDDQVVARLLTSPNTAVKPSGGDPMPLLDCSSYAPPDPRQTVEVPRPQ